MTRLHELWADYDAAWAAFREIPREKVRAHRDWEASQRGEWPRPGTESERVRAADAKLQQARQAIHEEGERDFEADLRDALRDRMREGDKPQAGLGHALGDYSRHFAVDVYRALCNVDWEHDDGSRFGCTWRYAGGLVADIRDMGEDYLDFYCSGGEGTVTPEVADAMAERGWHVGSVG